MASHIDNIRGSGLPVLDKPSFYSQLQWGDLVFCQGLYAISKGIEAVTRSPFSHVLMVWLPPGATEWLTMESTAQKGVHIGKLSDYVDFYDGDIVFARRPLLSTSDRLAQLNVGYGVLEDAYDYIQEGSIVAHKLLRALPVLKPKSEYYCSGLQYLMSCATPHPLQMPGPNLPTPEDNWTDATVVPIGCYLK